MSFIVFLTLLSSALVNSFLDMRRITVSNRNFYGIRSLSLSRELPDMEEIVNLCKKKGIVFQSAEIYSPLAGFYDYGPIGVELKNNIKKLWWRDMIHRREDIVGIDCSIISSPLIWKASGHVGGFSDPMVDCKVSKLRFRADQVYWAALYDYSDNLITYVSVVESEKMLKEATDLAIKIAKSLGKSGPFKPLDLKDLLKAPLEIYHLIPSPKTGKQGDLTVPRDFNLMFQTSIGAVESDASTAYLRPETAQGIFTNFLAIQRTSRLKIPFGVGQIGKAFRNEITPRNFIFRSREFEQMEIEYFVRPDESWINYYDEWIDIYWKWLVSIGVNEELLSRKVHRGTDLAHYARACTDITFRYPFGVQELMGIAARGDYDLVQHSAGSGKKLEYNDAISNTKYVPHVIEPSIGIDRLLLALIVSAYREEIVGGEKRVYLSFHPSIAPVKVAVLPLVSNKEEIVDASRKVFKELQKRFVVEYDTSGAIGRRYRRADESGIPFCVTVDFDSLNDKSVTIRYRDSMEQQRIKIEELADLISKQVDN